MERKIDICIFFGVACIVGAFAVMGFNNVYGMQAPLDDEKERELILNDKRMRVVLDDCSRFVPARHEASGAVRRSRAISVLQPSSQYSCNDARVEGNRVNMRWASGSLLETSQGNPYIKSIEEILVENFENKCDECCRKGYDCCDIIKVQIMSLVFRFTRLFR